MMPLYIMTLPKVKRLLPLMLSTPTVASSMPSAPLTRPFMMLLPLTEAMIDRPNRARAKYSGAPKLMAIWLMGGEKNSRASALTSPPKVEATSAISSALSGLPFLASG